MIAELAFVIFQLNVCVLGTNRTKCIVNPSCPDKKSGLEVFRIRGGSD